VVGGRADVIFSLDVRQAAVVATAAAGSAGSVQLCRAIPVGKPDECAALTAAFLAGLGARAT
jgi:hypothetical protein